MTIEVVQICDSCGKTRLLNVNHKAGQETIQEASRTDWWVKPIKALDICDDCIKGLIEKEPKIKWKNS